MTPSPSLRTWTAIALACLLVMLANSVFAVEWSFPYCNHTNAHDGPAYAVYGFPLPYTQFSGASSLVFETMPLAWLFDAAVLGGVSFWTIRWALGRLRSRAAMVALALAGGVPAAGLIVLEIVYASQFSTARLVLMPHYDGGYVDLRPVGIGHVSAANCQQSRFWFGPVTERIAQ